MSIISDEIASIFDDTDDNDNDNNINNTNNINISTNRIEESNYSQLIDYEEEFGISSDSFVRNEFIENHFINSDEMEKQGDCFFDSILAILKEFNETEYTDKKAIDLRKNL